MTAQAETIKNAETIENAEPLDAALPKPKADLLPLALPAVLALAMLPFVSFSTWVTLTIAGLAMGMMIFVMASGLTLVFGLMHVLNFGHGAFISVGAYAATLVLLPLAGFTAADSFWLNLAALVPALVVAVVVSGALGLVFERVLIVPVYGQHLKQILITMGGLTVAEETLKALWGPQAIPLLLPTSLRGSFLIGDVTIEKYRLLAVIVGLAIFVAMLLVLNRTKIGLLIRAGVENSEMVEALGYRISRLFGLMVRVFIVVIVGGLGSVNGCFLASILAALLVNYAGFLAPKLAAVSDILLMVCVLLWRPRGLYQVSSR
jgi:branched-chain amino acid transport system permease protein